MLLYLLRSPAIARQCGMWGEHKTENHPGKKDDGSGSKDGGEGKLAVHVLNGAMGSNF